MSDKIEKKVDGLTFGDAIHYMKNGSKMARPGWNGKGMFLYLVDCKLPEPNPKINCDYVEFDISRFIVMKTADNALIPWLASQTDMLAEDWMEV